MKRGTYDYAITMSGILQIIILCVCVFSAMILDYFKYYWQSLLILPAWGLMIWGMCHLTDKWTKEANDKRAEEFNKFLEDKIK